jgi:hypothetical protein
MQYKKLCCHQSSYLFILYQSGLLLCLVFLLLIYFHCFYYIQTKIQENVVVHCTMYPNDAVGALQYPLPLASEVIFTTETDYVPQSVK